jgi:hypothetical protein
LNHVDPFIIGEDLQLSFLYSCHCCRASNKIVLNSKHPITGTGLAQIALQEQWNFIRTL